MPVDFASRDSQESKAFKVVKAKAKQAEEFANFIDIMTRLLKERKPKCRVGDISPEIYQNDPMQQTDEISALPNELKCLVWSYLDKQADKLMFALTCKWNAATYEGLKNKQTQPAFKKVSPKSKVRATPSKKTAPPKKKPTDPERLEVLWRLQKWEPLSTKSIYKLCYKCICFIPRSYIFYPEKNCPFNWGGRHVDLNAPKMKTPKARTEGYRCPECSAFTAGQMVSGTKEYEEAERTTRKALDTKW